VGNLKVGKNVWTLKAMSSLGFKDPEAGFGGRRSGMRISRAELPTPALSGSGKRVFLSTAPEGPAPLFNGCD
jgi:hypothetical protein